MKAKPNSVSTAKKTKGATPSESAILKMPKKPVIEAVHPSEKPGARATRTAASRSEIRQITHRVMGSRQSQRPVERSGQPRKKRG